MTIFSLSSPGVAQRYRGATEYITARPNRVDRKSARSTVALSARTGFATSYSTESIDRSEGTVADEVGIDAELALLQRVAVREDAHGFAAALGQIDWAARGPEDFAYVAELALLAGANQSARQVAEAGADHFPTDLSLARLVAVLAPPRVVALKKVSAVTAAERKANLAWLRQNAVNYSGRWVALHGGHLVAQSHSAQDVMARLGAYQRQQVLITQIP